MTRGGWDAWTALEQAGGTVPQDKVHYVHDDWVPLYDAIAAGRIVAKGAATPGGEGRDISELFGADLYIDPWTGIAEGPGYTFYDVRFWPVNSPALKRAGKKKLTDEDAAASYKENVAAILKDKKRPPITKEDDVWRRGAGATVVQMRKLRDKYRKAKGLK